MADMEKVEQDINDLKNAYNSLLESVRRIERALSRDRYIPTRWHSIYYSHPDRQLIFDKRYPMQFEKNEADLLGSLFYKTGKKAGLPKSDEFVIAKIAKDNERLNLNPQTHKACYQALKRINDRVFTETHIELFQLKYRTVRFNDFAKHP